MGSSILGFIVWISLLLANNHSSVLANLTNTTLYSTHPQLTYAPESCCMKGPFGKCVKRYDPFTMTTYVDPNLRNRTFFQTSSLGNEPNSSNMKRRVEISFYGQAMYVYSPPRAQLDNSPGTIQVSLNGLVLATVDLEAKYRETDEDLWGPRLIYHWQGVGVDASHTLQISLLDSGSRPIRGFGIDSVLYTSLEPRRPPKYELSESEKLEELTIHDTNFATIFTPAHAWEKHVSAFISSDGIQRTFHGTSNRLAYTSHDTAAMPVAEFTAQCAALAIYGPSPTQLEAAFGEGFRHGHLQICLGMTCEYIDTHQAYLRVIEHLKNEPVLIYSTDRMSPSSPQAVKMRFLDPSSPVGHLWVMAFSHAVCSQVIPKWPWKHPIPDGRYSTHLVPFNKLDCAPSFLFGAFSPWTRTYRCILAPAEPYWLSGEFGDMPSWSSTVQGHDIKIFVPSPFLFPTSQYANVRCCIDGRCHYPDIEQWLMKVGESQSDILLVHYQDLNPFQAHQISVTAVRKEDEVGNKVIAVSRVEYQRVEVIRPAPSRPSPPSSTPTPTELPQPNPDEPVLHDDDDIVAVVLAALAKVVAVVSAALAKVAAVVSPVLAKVAAVVLPALAKVAVVVLLALATVVAVVLAALVKVASVAAAVLAFAATVVAWTAVAFIALSVVAVIAPICVECCSALSRQLERSQRRPENQGLLGGYQGPNTTYHHHRQHPLSPSGTDGFGAFTSNGYRSGNSQFASDAPRPAVRAVQPFSPASTDSDIPPSYFDRTAPPSYDACATSDALITTPPQPHAPITAPAPPPGRTDGSSGYRRTGESVDWDDQQPSPSQQTTEGFAGQ